MERKAFPLRDILSIVFFINVSKTKLDIVAVLEYLIGESVFDVQFNEAVMKCRIEILLQHPQLDVREPNKPLDARDVEPMVSRWENMFGTELPLNPSPSLKSQIANPIESYLNMIKS